MPPPERERKRERFYLIALVNKEEIDIGKRVDNIAIELYKILLNSHLPIYNMHQEFFFLSFDFFHLIQWEPY